MYLEHFGLASNPFGLSPRLDYLYRSDTFEESMAHLVYGLDSNEALVLITGPIGTGKTMAIQSFLANLGPGFATALVTNTRVTAVELLKLVLDDLEVPYPHPSDKSDLLIAFKNFLIQSGRSGRRVIIVIDEAQNLGTDVLEEVRLLTNLGQGESQVVQLVLVGQPELEALVDRPDLAQLRQRIRVHYRLQPLTRSELESYIEHRLRVAGCDRRVFASKAYDEVFRLSRGVPRLVNALAGGAMLAAFVAGRHTVEAVDVDETEIPAVDSPGRASPPPVPPAQAAQPAAPPPPPPPAPEPVVAPRPATAPPPPPPPEPEPPAAGEIPLTITYDGEPEGRRAASYAERRGGGRRVGLWPLGAIAVAAALAIWLFYGGGLETVRGMMPREDSGATAGGAETAEPVVEQAGIVAPTGQREAGEVAVATPSADAESDLVAERAPTEPPAPLTEGVAVHVGSFRTADRAQTFAANLQEAGEPAFTRTSTVSRVVWHRVYVGLYADREAAQAAIARLRGSFTLQYAMTVRMDLADTR